MTPLNQPQRPRSVIVIGAGIVGMAAAWLLVQRGHGVTLVDPDLAAAAPSQERLSGSRAALGLLMADVFHRRRGRAWRLRQRSLELWAQWQQQLEGRGLPLVVRPGLLLLAHDGAQWQRHQALVDEGHGLGLPLELWPQERIEALLPEAPSGCVGGLYSPRDGQLDAEVVLSQWLIDGQRFGLEVVAAAARRLERSSEGWRLHLASGEERRAEVVVLAAGLELATLWPEAAAASSAPQLAPVLGQALELQVPEDIPDPWHWPGSLAWQGINLVPRPGRRLWLGATLEPGMTADPAALERLRTLEGQAPDWLRRSRVLRRWEGLRVKPLGQPAPLCLQPAADLLVVGGTYRNGVLLAPTLAEWVVECVQSS